MDDGTRLNKFLASCGVGSRRTCDRLVQDGHVEINGQPCLNPATRVEPGDHVKLDGRRVAPKQESVVILHKPKGLVCTKADERKRGNIFDLLPGSMRHLQHVGRLDRESEGLLVLTNDGDLAQAMLHPSKKVEKEYWVTANQPVADEHIATMLSGIYTDDGRLSAERIEKISPRRLSIVLTSGHKRQIRVMFEKLGYRVQRLLRVRIGSLELGALPPGKWARLQPSEIGLLLENPPLRQVRRAPRSKPGRPRPPRR
jgi:23S rRNA pseudouridine2605 synthase